MTDYMHPGYRKPYPIQTVLRDLASQEGCDGEPYDAMVFAADLIDALQREIDALRAVSVEDVAAALWREQVVDTGTPKSVLDGRTPEAFSEQSDHVRNHWFKFANAAIAKITTIKRGST